jgi:hypothetical protein
LQLTSRSPDLVIGVPMPCAVQASDVRGNPTTAAVRWSVRPANAASVSETGVVVAKAEGAFVVVATANTETGGRPIEGTLEVRARAPKLTALRLSAPKPSLRVGERMLVAADAVMEGGASGSGMSPKWSIDDESVARISASGEVEALAAGTATATATAGGLRESVTISVTAARSPALLWGGGVGALATVAIVAAVFLRDDPNGATATDQPVVATPDSVVTPSQPSTDQPPVVLPEPTVAQADPPPPAVVEPPPAVEPRRPDGAARPGDPPARGVAAADRPTTVATRTPTVRPPTTEPAARNAAPPVEPTRPGAAAAAAVTPPVERIDSAPPARTEVAGPSSDDMRSLASDYVGRLNRGEFRTGEFASFFSRTTSAHRATMVGQPRVASRQGDALLVDVDMQVERTLGSGAIDRRTGTVRLTLRGRAGAAAIESATPGALTRAR